MVSAQRSTIAPRLVDRLRRDRWFPATLFAVVVAVGAPTFALVGTPHASMMGPLYHFGIVLPTCGLTRGVVAIAAGRVGRAVAFNPISPVVAAAALVLTARAIFGVTTGRWMYIRFRVTRRRVAAGIVAATGLWMHQQANAAFIIHHMR